jgi:hypothetical protein
MSKLLSIMVLLLGVIGVSTALNGQTVTLHLKNDAFEAVVMKILQDRSGGEKTMESRYLGRDFSSEVKIEVKGELSVEVKAFHPGSTDKDDAFASTYPFDVRAGEVWDITLTQARILKWEKRVSHHGRSLVSP